MAGNRVFQQQRHLQAGRGQVGGRVLDTGRGVQVGGQDQRQELPRVHGQEAAEPRPLHQQEGKFNDEINRFFFTFAEKLLKQKQVDKIFCF